ncbi:MAG: PIN domain-containing protein [Bacteroidales bacterium]|nr:PIN domain-containing protein [Bacteroidales bacterium]
MNDRVFLDTNILVYSYSATDLVKQKIARKLVAENLSYISTQVLQELANTLTKKFGNTWKDTQKAVVESGKNNLLHVNNQDTIANACDIADKYQYSFYDSLIVSAAMSCNCTTLYSEDMQHGQMVENKLKIVNPFI